MLNSSSETLEGEKMEAKFDIGGPAAQSNAVKFYYSKRKESISRDHRRSAGSRQLLCSAPPQPAPCSNDELEVGAFYEIDHEKLPPKSPIHLKAVRVVKVSETTKLDVTASFPSAYSLRNYFSSLNSNKGGHQYQIPEMDERFVMSTNHAGKILRRLVTASQMNGEKHLQSFWLVAPFILPIAAASPKAPAAAVEKEEEEEEADQESKTALQSLDALQLALKFSGRKLEWGVRRKVSYIGRQQQPESPPPSPKTEDDAGETMGMEEEEEEKEELQNVIFTRKRARDECKKNKKKNKKEKAVERKEMKKRKKKKPRYEIKEEKKATKNKETNESGRGRGGSKERWSAERYKSAELKLLEIMREKRAVLGNPILRQQLREEARKHIGDTGLLDHLLKHMAGKVVSEGAELFRRRHNAQGAMEYWLEPKELDEARRKAGLMDPYWLPPPGWKPGDAIATSSACQCGADQCQKEITQMREEIRILKRDVEDLHDLKQLEREEEEHHHLSQAAAYSVLQENYEGYEGLAEKNTKLEEEVAVLVNTVKELKEEILLLKQHKDKTEKEEEEEKAALAADQVEKKKNSNGIDEVDLGGVAVGKKKGSGFRICKPQGTFLWPNMMIAGGGITTSCNNVIVSSSSICSSPAAIFSTMSSPTTMISTITTASINGGDAVVVPAATKSMEQQQQLAAAAMAFGGGGGGGAGGIPTPPSCSSSTTAAPKLLALPIPSPTTPKSSTSSSPAPPASQQLPRAHATDLMMQQQLPSVQLVNPQQQQQDKIAAAAQASSSAAAGDHQPMMKKRDHEDVHVLRAGAAVWSTITTDLVLATPSPSYNLNLN